MQRHRILMVYLEPAAYVLDLIRCLRESSPAAIDVCFASIQMTQRWDRPLDTSMEVLPANRWQLWCRLRQLMASGGYRLVHLAGWGGHPVLPMALILARCYRIQVSVETDTPLAVGQSRLKSLLKALVMPLWFRLPALFLPGGRRQAALLKHYGVEESRMAIVGMTVDVAAIIRHIDSADRKAIRQTLGVAEHEVVILYVGRMEPLKGIHELLEAFQRLHQARGFTRLLLVGEGSLSGWLQSLAAGTPGVLLAGRLSGAPLLDMYAAADFLVLPSHFESWGLVVNEAMAAGLPVVVSERAGCVDDLVQEGHNGFRVPPYTSTALEAAMHRLVEDAGLRQTMGQASRKIMGHWTLEAEAARMLAAWGGLGN